MLSGKKKKAGQILEEVFFLIDIQDASVDGWQIKQNKCNVTGSL